VRPFDYQRAGSADDACRAVAAGATPLGGGTDLLREMKRRLIRPERLVDLTAAPDLGHLAVGRQGLVAGGSVRLGDLERHPEVARLWPCLHQAIEGVATPQIRNLATLAGSLLQRPSCWYYRGGFDCLLRGGRTCSAAHGDNRYGAIFAVSPCVAGHPSDVAAALIALGATVLLRRGRSERRIPLELLYAPPTHAQPTELRLRTGETLCEVHVPGPAAGMVSAYLRARDRATWAFALVGLAACLDVRRGMVHKVNLIAAGVAPLPWRLRAAEDAMRGHRLDIDAAQRAAPAAIRDALPLPTSAYKTETLQSLVRRLAVTP
jgi:xanthine dehydrogenase YagS FAD-binding subunit